MEQQIVRPPRGHSNRKALQASHANVLLVTRLHFFGNCFSETLLQSAAAIPAHKVLVARPEEKMKLGRPRFRCEDNIRMHFKEVG